MKKNFSTLIFCLVVATGAFAVNNLIENLAPTGDLTPLVAALESARLYPVFILPMGPGYYDFELKGSITNFSSNIPNASLEQQMVYWYASAVDSNPGTPVWDYHVLVCFTTTNFFYDRATIKGLKDRRAWAVAANNESLVFQTSGAINHIVVIPSKIVGSATWMFKGNTNLVWSYCRINAVGTEKDSTGTTVWNPIVPVDWRSQQINP